MATVTINGQRAFETVISLPRTGAWRVDASVNTTSAITGACEIVIGNLTLKGYARVGGVYGEVASVRVIAGAGGLYKDARPKHYSNAPLRIPLNDLLSDAGETLSATSDAAMLATSLVNWTTIQAPTANLITALADAAGATWRMVADGTVWMGKESWPASSFTYDLERSAPQERRLDMVSDEPTLLPGTTLSGQRIGYVTHTISASSVRTVAWVES